MAVAVKASVEPRLVWDVDDEPPSEGPVPIEGAELKFQPVLLPPSVELFPGFQVAPPVAVESVIFM